MSKRRRKTTVVEPPKEELPLDEESVTMEEPIQKEPIEEVRAEEPIETVTPIDELTTEELKDMSETPPPEGEPLEEELIETTPPIYTITSPTEDYTREDAQVAGTIAVMVPRLPLGETITIKRVG